MKPRYVVIDRQCYPIKANVPDEKIKFYRKFHGTDVVFTHEQETELYRIYHFIGASTTESPQATK